MENKQQVVSDAAITTLPLPPALAPILMMVFWMLLGGATGIKTMDSILRARGAGVGEFTFAIVAGGVVGALTGALLGLIKNPRLLVLLMAVFAGATAGGVAGQLPWGDAGQIGGQVAGGLIGGIAWAIWLLVARAKVPALSPEAAVISAVFQIEEPVTLQRKVSNTMPSNMNSVVAVFDTHDQAESAIRELQKDGFDMKKLSIVGRDYHAEERVVGYYTTGDRMLYWGKLGAFWGGFWGLLMGSAFFWVPGMGQLLVAGPLVAWIVGALGEAAVVGGLSALGAGLYSIGIPKNSVMQYETQVKDGKLLLVAHGTVDEVERAKEILEQTDAKTTTVHGEKVAVTV